MKRTAKQTRRGNAFLLASTIAALALTAGGCVLDFGGGQDLEVVWAIDGRTNAALCEAYDVDHFVIEARGPEWVEVTAPCGAWDSGTTLHWLYDGRYQLSVEARDALGRPRARLEQTVDLYAPDWEITVVPFDFYGSDFGARQRVSTEPVTPVADAGDGDDPTVADPSDEGPSSKRLDVSWTVNGRSAGDAGCCDALNIGRWELTLSGAEERTVTSICGEHEWNTGDELHNLSAGSYRITLQAYDPAGQPLGSAATRTVELDAERSALTLTIDLSL